MQDFCTFLKIEHARGQVIFCVVRGCKYISKLQIILIVFPKSNDVKDLRERKSFDQCTVSNFSPTSNVQIYFNLSYYQKKNLITSSQVGTVV